MDQITFLSAKARREFLFAIQEALNIDFSSPVERRSVTQLVMKLHQIWELRHRGLFHAANIVSRSPEEFKEIDEQVTPPFSVMVQDFNILRDLETQASTDMIQGIYLKKDDPKIIALMLQAEILSSLALKFDTENKDQSIDSASKILQEFLNQSKDAGMIRLRITDVDFQLENSKDSVDDLKFSREDIQQSWRAPHFLLFRIIPAFQ